MGTNEINVHNIVTRCINILLLLLTPCVEVPGRILINGEPWAFIIGQASSGLGVAPL